MSEPTVAAGDGPLIKTDVQFARPIAAAAKLAAGDRRSGRQPVLRRQAGAVRHLDGHRREAGDRVHRAVGMRQVDAAALPEPDERPHRQRADHRHVQRARTGPLRRHDRRHRGAAADRHGVPEVEPAAEVDLRERRLRPAHRRHQDQGDARRGLRAEPAEAPRSGTKSRTGCTRAACRSRAASSSGCASPARSPSSRRSS